MRDGRGSILRRAEGVFGRAWHAHTPRRGRGGFKERDTLRQFIPVTPSVSLLIFLFFDKTPHDYDKRNYKEL